MNAAVAEAAVPPRASRQALAQCAQLARLAERTAANADFARRGQRLLDEARLELGPFAAVPLDGFGAWEADPLANRSWQWRLNWLSFVAYLVARQAASGDVRALPRAVEAVLSWLDHFGPPARRHAFEFAWHDHATALRAEQMALLVHCIERADAWAACGGEAAATRIVQALREHAELLAHDEFFSRHTNHGLEQARVLLLLATALDVPGDAQAAGWRASALARIEGELRHAFTDEGVHVENSPAYHAFVFKVFLGIVDEYPADTLGPLHAWMSEIGPRALEFLARILRPDGQLPIIGDTEALPVSDSFKATFAGQPAYEAFRYAQSLGRAGQAPEGLHKIYPRSGYAIFRSDWPAAQGYRRATHLVVKAGASSRYHRQQDDASLVLFHETEDWLIDSGMFGYEKDSPIRQYMRSRAAHNVVVLDRPLEEIRSADPKAVWAVLASSDDPGAPFVTLRSSAYPGALLERRVSLTRRRTVRVEDTISVLDGRPVTAQLLWHVPADKTVEVLGPAEVLVRSTRTARVMRLCVRGDLPDNVKVRAGVNQGRVWSVVSHAANEHQASQVIVFTVSGRQHAHLHTDLSFEVSS